MRGTAGGFRCPKLSAGIGDSHVWMQKCHASRTRCSASAIPSRERVASNAVGTVRMTLPSSRHFAKTSDAGDLRWRRSTDGEHRATYGCLRGRAPQAPYHNDSTNPNASTVSTNATSERESAEGPSDCVG